MKSFLIRSVVLSSTVLLGSLAFLAIIYRSTQSEPDFYRRALNVDAVVDASAGEALEIEALEMRNQIVNEDQWYATFTDEQMNGWLAIDLPDKFPGRLPKSVSDPRLQVENGKVTLACRYHGKAFQGIVQLECEPFMTEADNEIGLKVCHLKSGWVPLPIDTWLNEVSRQSLKVGLPIRWIQDGGQPVALLVLPLDSVDKDRKIVLEQLICEKGQLHLSGRTEPADAVTESEPAQIAEGLPADDQSIRQ